MESAREKSLTLKRLPLAVILVCLSLCFFACKSASVAGEEETHPLSLLNDGALLYLTADASFHSELLVALLASRVRLSQEDAQRLSGRLGIICVAAGGNTSFDLACTARIPKRMAESRLSKASSTFTKQKVSLEGFRGKKFTHISSGLEVAFIEQGLLCAGEDVSAMLENFVQHTALDQNPRNDWLLGAEDEPSIRFYTEKPYEFLTAAMGFPKGIGGNLLESIAGSLTRSDEGYIVEMYFRVANARAVAAFRAMLTLSLGMRGTTVEQPEELLLKVSGIELSMQELTRLFSQDWGMAFK